MSYQAPAEADTTGYDYSYGEGDGGAAEVSTLSLPQLTARPQTAEGGEFGGTALAVTQPYTSFDDSNDDGNSYHASDYTDTDSEFTHGKGEVLLKVRPDSVPPSGLPPIHLSDT